MPEKPFEVGDVVVHKATRKPAVVVEIIDDDDIIVSYDYHHECTCRITAVEKQ